MIPLGDALPTRTAPGVTLAFVVASLVSFAWQASLDVPGQLAWSSGAGVVPASPWTPAFLAAAWLQRDALGLAGASLMLVLFGPALEDRCGHGRFLGLLLAAGGAALVAHIVSAPGSTGSTSAAGGAVAGVVGGYLVLFRQSKVVFLVPLVVTSRLVEVLAVAVQALWFAVEAARHLDVTAAGVRETLGAEGYAAGFATGAIAVVMLKRPERMRPAWWSA